MRITIRADGNPTIGGGHVMRCLTMARAARGRGHEVAFVTAVGAGSFAGRISAEGFTVAGIEPRAHDPSADPEAPAHAGWLVTPWEEDAAVTAAAVAGQGADWLVVDHYGLDARWTGRVRAAMPELRVLAIDDLDDRALGADLVLDQTRMGGGSRRHSGLANLTGPDYALLRPEFAAARPAALSRRGQPVRRVLIAPGLADAAGLAPLALDALKGRPELSVDVVMGAESQSCGAVATRIAGREGAALHLDATDMAGLMTRADLCIGAGGMTGWERCCLGLPTVAVAVADNQRPGLRGLSEAGAVVAMGLEDARMPGALTRAIGHAIETAQNLSVAAARLCDGQGAARVLDALEGRFRPVTEADARLLFDWRNRPEIRAVSLNRDELDWAKHVEWVRAMTRRTDGEWLIYAEGGRDLGHASARDTGDGTWQWSFYIGEADAPKGAGGRMTAAFLRRLFAQPSVRAIRAEVVPGNAASEALHRRLGFRCVSEPDAGVLVFVADRCDVRGRMGLPEEGH
ncbi:UDP-2,4-diacetamido-2,4,6-trideoxy-beta-L-altropyranose hydrolase [Defluviimonas sp. SAOS-178_SWC]|uniref:UDP-2,4-diacetamido-2,4, 6-trideoxy-beta-L-altropyranose hydrolase n=1 Tax=Defluviimonas sp. SAOS-178_SWC TaxID=3121287 RepID=UPI003221C2E4